MFLSFGIENERRFTSESEMSPGGMYVLNFNDCGLAGITKSFRYTYTTV